MLFIYTLVLRPHNIMFIANQCVLHQLHLIRSVPEHTRRTIYSNNILTIFFTIRRLFLYRNAMILAFNFIFFLSVKLFNRPGIHRYYIKIWMVDRIVYDRRRLRLWLRRIQFFYWRNFRKLGITYLTFNKERMFSTSQLSSLWIANVKS